MPSGTLLKPADAKAIVGARCASSEAACSVLKLKQPVAPAKAALERVRFDEQTLGIETGRPFLVPVVAPLTLDQMWQQVPEAFSETPQYDEKKVLKPARFARDPFWNTPLEVGWYLVRTGIERETLRKPLSEQLRSLTQGEELAPVRLLVYTAILLRQLRLPEPEPKSTPGMFELEGRRYYVRTADAPAPTAPRRSEAEPPPVTAPASPAPSRVGFCVRAVDRNRDEAKGRTISRKDPPESLYRDDEIYLFITRDEEPSGITGVSGYRFAG